MQIDFNFIVIFQFLAIVQGTTTVVILLRSKETQGNSWLAMLVLAMTLQSASSFLSTSGLYRDYPWLYFSPLFFSWSYGAVIHFYLKTLREPSFTFRRGYLWHFLPAVLQFLFYATISIQSLDFKAWFWIQVHKPYTRFVDVYVSIALIFTYLWMNRAHWPQSPKHLRRFFLAWAAFLALAAIDPVINAWYLPPRAPKFYLMEFLLPVYTYWLATFIFVKEKKQQKSNLQAVLVKPENLQRIVEVVEASQLYLQPAFSLADLAAATGMNTSILSQTINAGLQQSFNDFINEYRVAAVRQKLDKGEHLQSTLLGIALDCGFNSKNTFNRAFKKSTGMTPREYLDQKSKPALPA